MTESVNKMFDLVDDLGTLCDDGIPVFPGRIIVNQKELLKIVNAFPNAISDEINDARIILKNPSVVILDEATSSIDTETENLIKLALDKILKDKTAFMVAHRLSTIRSADRILYISNKGIAEEGTHEELMAMKGLYYSLN